MIFCFIPCAIFLCFRAIKVYHFWIPLNWILVLHRKFVIWSVNTSCSLQNLIMSFITSQAVSTIVRVTVYMWGILMCAFYLHWISILFVTIFSTCSFSFIIRVYIALFLYTQTHNKYRQCWIIYTIHWHLCRLLKSSDWAWHITP